MSTIDKTVTTLPEWAFKALASAAIDAMIDRTSHEIIIMTRRGVPDVVLMSSEDWNALVAAAAQRRHSAPTKVESNTHS